MRTIKYSCLLTQTQSYPLYYSPKTSLHILLLNPKQPNKNKNKERYLRVCYSVANSIICYVMNIKK